MPDLPPDVRDRAARAAQLSDAGGSWIPVWDSFHDENREYWRAIVDAVAEVLAADARPPNDYSGGPARSERELLLEAQVAELMDRVITLEAQRAGLLERCRQADRSKSLPELSTGEVRRALGIPLLGGPDA